MNNHLVVLQKCLLFKNKSLKDIEYFLSNITFKIKKFESMETILSPVQTADKIGIILSGTVDIQKVFPNGKMIILERKTSPSIIGESSVFSKYEYYPDNISSCKSCEILFISKTDLIKLFSLDKELLFNLLEYISNTALMFRHKIGILSLDSIQEKIAGYLFYEMHYANETIVDTIELPFSKKDWAEYLDVSRTSLSRELRNLASQEIISFEKRTIIVKDKKRLAKILAL
jgi:CRP-like cAMP-binding protein